MTTSLSQDVKIGRVIESCFTEEHFECALSWLRVAAIPPQEKLTWFELLKDKATKLGIKLNELHAS